MAHAISPHGEATQATRPAEHSFTQTIRALLALVLEGASLGLGAFALSLDLVSLVSHARNNGLPATTHKLAFSCMGGGIALVTAFAAIVTRARVRRGEGPFHAEVEDVSRRLLPAVLAGTLPFLFCPQIWHGRDLSFLLLSSLVSLGALWLFGLSMAARPLFPSLSLLRRETLEAMLIGKPRRQRFVFEQLPLIVTIVAALTYAALFSVVTIWNHWNLRTLSFDLGLENNLLWNVLHGAPLFKSSPLSGPTGTHFGHHATFLAFVLAIPYACYQHPETLLVLQALLIGGAAIPLFLYARLYVAPWTAAFLAALYLAYPPLHGANLYDFHYLPLGPFFLWWTLWAFETKRPIVSAVALLLTLSVREDVAANAAVFGGYLVLSGRRPYAGVVLASIAGVYFVVMKLGIMPLYNEGTESFISQYKGLLPPGERGFGGVLKTVAINPAFTADTLFEKDKLVYLLQLFLPLAFVPLRRPMAAWFFLPGTFFTLLSTGYDPLYQISFQYSTHWTTFAFIAAAHQLSCLRTRSSLLGGVDWTKTRAAMIAMGLGSLIATYHYGLFFQQSVIRGGFGHFIAGRTTTDRLHYAQLRELVAQVPPRAKIASSENLVPHVSSRPDSYTLRFSAYDAEYLLFTLPIRSDEEPAVGPALRKGTFGVVDVRGNFALAKAGHPITKNAEVLRRLH